MGKKERGADETKEPKKEGAPAFAWTAEIEDAILDEIMDGEVPAVILGKGRDPRFPGVTTFYKWIRDNDEFAKKYARALEVRTDSDVDEIRSIVMAPAVIAESVTGSHVDSGDVALRRLQVDALKWTASKRLPKKYGDKLEIESTVIDRRAPVDPAAALAAAKQAEEAGEV